jgi:predicted DNA-binding transcriptional regulator AlpA
VKATITLKAQAYDSARVLKKKYGIYYPTLVKWAQTGILPEPVKIGRFVYYNREAVENYLLGVK